MDMGHNHGNKVRGYHGMVLVQLGLNMGMLLEVQELGKRLRLEEMGY